MNVTKFTLHNIGIIEHFELVVNKALYLFYGEIKQGKTTILNGFRWNFGGEFPADIMRHGQKEGYIETQAEDDGVPLLIRREFYVNKDGETTSRPLVFKRDGVDQPRPAETLKRFLNPFVMDDRYFVDMTDLEKGRYLCRLFNVDTRAEDKQIGAMAEEASQLRITIKAYGEIIPVEIQPVDCADLLAKRAKIVEEFGAARSKAMREKSAILEAHKAECDAIENGNAVVDKRAQDRQTCNDRIAQREQEIADIEQQIKALEIRKQAAGDARVTLFAWRQGHPEIPRETLPPAPDVSALQTIIDSLPDVAGVDARIQQAGAVNEQHKQYLRDKAAHQRKEDDEVLGVLVG